MPSSFSCIVFGLALSGLGMLAACSQPEPYALRRRSFDGSAVELVEAGGVARPGTKGRGGMDLPAMDLTGLSPGRVELFVAPSGAPEIGGGVDIDFHETGWRTWTGTALRRHCRPRWGEPGSPADTPWTRCSFDLPRAIGSARLELKRHGSRTGDILVSEVRMEGGQRRSRPDVFVLLLDALRFDGLRPFRAEAGIGDRIEALAKDGVVLRGLRSTSSWTRPAVASMFTGLRADRHRVQDRTDVLVDDAVTLAERLGHGGYSTAAWTTNPNVLPVWGLAQGFDAFVDQGSGDWVAGKTDGSVVVSRLRAALADRGPEPVFYYAHLMDPHAPYRPTKEQRREVAALPGIHSAFPRPLAIPGLPKDWSAFLDYTGELLDVDDHVGAFVDALKREGMYDDSLVIVVADHGEEFIDHGRRDHGLSLYEEVLHVPAIVKLPGNRHAGQVLEKSLSVADLMPTVLAEVGLEAPTEIDGHAIRFEAAPATAAETPHIATLRLDGRRQSTIVDPPWKLIRYDLFGRLELYNLDEDPRERMNVLNRHPDVAQQLAAALEVLLGQGQEGWHLAFCGTLGAAEMDLVVHVPPGKVSRYGFEAGEAESADAPSRSWRLRPDLTPLPVEGMVMGRLTKTVRPDQPEFRILPEDPTAISKLEVVAESGSAFTVLTGPSGEAATSSRLSLESDSQAVVVPHGGRIECPPATAQGSAALPKPKPLLRVWYVPPVAKVAAEELDPGMVQRLRALGYLQ